MLGPVHVVGREYATSTTSPLGIRTRPRVAAGGICVVCEQPEVPTPTPGSPETVGNAEPVSPVPNRGHPAPRAVAPTEKVVAGVPSSIRLQHVSDSRGSEDARLQPSLSQHFLHQTPSRNPTLQLLQLLKRRQAPFHTMRH